jgi:uncharacterized protein (TIGR00255 family)
MTGYGAAEHLGETVRVAAEVKSINNRFLKLNLRTPEGFGAMEVEIEKLLREDITRGTINLNLSVEPRGESARAPINMEILMAYVRDLEPLAKQARRQLDLAGLLDLPGVVGGEKELLTGIEGLPELVMKVVRQAVERLDAMRRTEGEATARDMESALAEMERQVAAITVRAPTLVEEYRKRLRERIEVLLQGVELSPDDQTLTREVTFYAERTDVNEELARLSSHIEQFRALLAESGPAGRKLEFLTQEMGREVNTLGSKSGDSQVSRGVVELKVAVDRLREQSANVE